MLSKMLNKALVGATLWALSTTGAWALPLSIISGGLTATNANYGCPTGSPLCQTNADYTLSAPANATGSIELNLAGTVATVNMFVSSVTFAPTGAGSPITFTGVTYTGTVNVFSVGDVISSLGPGTSSVSGTANGNPFAVSPQLSILNCAGGLCGITFGKPGFTNVETHDWVHTFNVAVPEPTAALLVLLGVAGLAIRARRI